MRQTDDEQEDASSGLSSAPLRGFGLSSAPCGRCDIHMAAFNGVSSASVATATAAGAALHRCAIRSGHVGRLGTAVAEAAEFDRGLVNEEILAVVIGSDETETLLIVDPLDRSLLLIAVRHYFSALRRRKRRR
ncbi:hypothetical protein SASPL_149868 [Salvia splendens]|uniref:Uncharacterized protein n=1 Tax=Salvia splendens TaxID=180675 RepID=A0A8X8Z2C6_SALSN|nr:hypothetical protein SASPL_149868 [Salvia splendens]